MGAKKQYEISKNWKIGDHIFICGMTGTGKTYSAIKIIKDVIKNNFIIFDRKEKDFNNLGCVKVKNFNEFLCALSNKKTKILIQDPKLKTEEIEQKEALYNKYIYFIYDNIKSFTIIIDELHAVITKHRILSSIATLLQEGRESDKGKSFIGISQSTKNINNVVLAQTRHFISFYLALKRDRDDMSIELDLSDNNLSFKDLKLYECIYFFRVFPHKPLITKF